MTQGFDIVSGRVNLGLSQAIAKQLHQPLIATELRRFANGEQYVRIAQPIRRRRIYLLATCCIDESYSLNDSLLEAILLADASRRAAASEIIAVLPYLPYSRQDRKAREREPISVAAVLNLFRSVGVDHFVTIDLHSLQTQAAVHCAFDNLTARPLILKQIRAHIKAHPADYVVVAPDAGSIKSSTICAQQLNIPLVFLPKLRDHQHSSRITRPDQLAGVKDKNCLILDDMIDTGGTLMTAATVLKRSGASQIIAAATHGLLSQDAATKIKASDLDFLYLTDTIPQTHNQSILSDRLRVLSVAPLLAQAIQRIDSGASILELSA